MDYEFRNANAWEETGKIAPVRKAKKPRKKNNKKKNVAPSVTGSVRAASPARSASSGTRIPSPTRSATGRAPESPARSVSSRNSNVNTARATSPARSTSSRSSNRNASRATSPARSTSSRSSNRNAGRATSPARSVSSAGGRARSGSSSVWGAAGATSRAQSVRSPSSVIAPSEYDDPWGENRGPSYPDLLDDFHDGVEEDEERNEQEDVYDLSAYNRPIYYDNGEMWGEADPYEGPDGLRRENEGVRLERLGAAPNGHFEIAERRSPTFDERFFGPRGVNLRHIAQKTNTYVSMPMNDSDPQVHIWGRSDQVSLAIRDLMHLSEHIFHQMYLGDKLKKEKLNKRLKEKDKGREGDWVRVRAKPSERKQRYLDQDMQKQRRCKELRVRPTRSPFEFNAVGVFLWPKELNAQDHLGSSFQLLDDVRVECDVWIVDHRQLDGYMFQVLGDEQSGVDKAVARLYGAFCAATARNREPMEKHLLHPPSMDIQNTRVGLVKERELENYQTIEKFSRSTMGARALLIGEFPSWKFVDEWKTRREIMERANDRFIKKVLDEGLKEVLYFRGHASLKINFGTLILFGYKEPPHDGFSIEDFSSMVRYTMAAGELIRHIGKEHIAKALINECHARTDLFHHVDRGHSKFAEDPYNDSTDGRGDIHDIRDDLELPDPTIQATFECTIFNGPYSSKLRLEVEFERIPGKHPGDMANAAGDLYRIGMRRWLFIRKSTNATQGSAPEHRKGPIDIKVMDLESDLAWQMELTTYGFCPDADKYAIFRDFVKKMRIEEIPDESDPIGPPRPGSADARRRVKRISYVNLPGLVVDKIVQKTKHQYWISRTSYKFEITQYECFFPESIGPSRLSLTKLYPLGIPISWKGLATDHDVRWGASLKNADWAHNLAQQASLSFGCSSDWEPEVDSFFKSSGVGGFDHPMWTRDKSSIGGPDPWEGDGWKELMTRAKELTKFIAQVRDLNLAFKEPGYAGPEEFDE